MNSVSSSDFTITNQLLENEESNIFNNDLIHIYIVATVFTLSVIVSLVYIFVFA